MPKTTSPFFNLDAQSSFSDIYEMASSTMCWIRFLVGTVLYALICYPATRTEGARRTNPFFDRYPVGWDSYSHSVLRRSLGSYIGDNVCAAGVYQTGDGPRVRQLLRGFHRDISGQGPEYKREAYDWIRLGGGESAVKVYGKNSFETEAILLAMAKSRLFRYVFPHHEAPPPEGGPPILTAVDRSLLFDDPVHPRGSEVAAKLERFFADCFLPSNPHARISVIDRGDFRFGVRVSHLRNTVVPRGGYWEELELYISFYTSLGVDTKGVTVEIYPDGKFAKGVGSRPPPAKKFQSLVDDYDDALQRIAEEICTAFGKFLRAGK